MSEGEPRKGPIPRQIFGAVSATGLAFGVLSAMWYRAAWEGDAATLPGLLWVSREKLAERVRLPLGTLRKRLAVLVRLGYAKRLADLPAATQERLKVAHVEAGIGLRAGQREVGGCGCRATSARRCSCRVLAPLDERGDPVQGWLDSAVIASPAKRAAPKSRGSMVEPRCGPTVEPHRGPMTEPHRGPAVEPHDSCGPAMEPHRGPTVEPHSGPMVEPHRGPTVEPLTLQGTQQGNSTGELNRSPQASTPQPAPTSLPGFALNHSPAEAPPKRDFAAEVVAYFNDRTSAAREWAGLSKSRGIKLLPARREAIEARIRECGGGDEGLADCKRVIDVQEAEARSHGQASKGDPASAKAIGTQPGWVWWKVATMFERPKNFARRLERWTEDGSHGVGGSSHTRGRSDPNYRASEVHGTLEADSIARTLAGPSGQAKRKAGRKDPAILAALIGKP